MSEVRVPFGDNPSETAILLLAAAADLDLDAASSVRTISGHFVVPQEVADHVEGLALDDTSGSVTEPDDANTSDADSDTDEGDTKDEQTTEAPAKDETPAPAKKVAAKKATTKKDKE